eukprot:2383165-Amphidinium_carterae.1
MVRCCVGLFEEGRIGVIPQREEYQLAHSAESAPQSGRAELLQVATGDASSLAAAGPPRRAVVRSGVALLGRAALCVQFCRGCTDRQAQGGPATADDRRAEVVVENVPRTHRAEVL